MSIIFLIVIILPIIITSLWFPIAGFIMFMLMFSVVSFMTLIPAFSKARPDPELRLTEEEAETFSKYNAFFRFSSGASSFSQMLVAIQIASIAFAILFFVKGFWYLAVVFIPVYFIVGGASAKLNPLPYIQAELEKENLKWSHEAMMIQAVMQKIDTYNQERVSVANEEKD